MERLIHPLQIFRQRCWVNEKLKRIKKIDNLGYIKDSDGYTNLRKERNKNSEIVQKINTNSEVEVLKDSDDWFLVKTKEGNIGYVHKSRISRKKINSIISSKWIGNYYVDIPTTREYLQTVKLKITLDSCVFIVTGLAENKKYELSMIEKNETLILKYVKLLKYESTYIEKDSELAKEKEFGYLIHDGENYLWISPYLDDAYYNGEKHKHIIKKIK